MNKIIIPFAVVAASFIFVAVMFGERVDPIWLIIALFGSLCGVIAAATYPGVR